MPENPRVTFYMVNHQLLREMASEDSKEFNGGSLEKLLLNDFCGNNKDLQDIVLSLYQNRISLREALQKLLDFIRYSGIKEECFFDVIPQIARDACVGSSWNEEETEAFSAEKRGLWQYLYNIVDEKFSWEMDHDEDFRELAEDNQSMEDFDWEDSGDLSRDYDDEMRVTIEAYLDLKEPKDKITKMMGQGNSMPTDFLNFIIGNWRLLYEAQETYRVIERCIARSTNVADNPILRKRLRNFVKFYSKVQDADRHYAQILDLKRMQWNDWLLDYIER